MRRAGCVPALLPDAPHYLQHERGGQLCGQRRGGKFLWGCSNERGEPASVPGESRGKRVIFDYIERSHNPGSAGVSQCNGNRDIRPTIKGAKGVNEFGGGHGS